MSFAYQLYESAPGLRRDVLAGLGTRPKTLPCKYLYDAQGSRLFDRICELEAYYPTRTELAILRSCVGEIASLVGRGARIVELGSGSGNKTRILLKHLREPAVYVPIDISEAPLNASAEALSRELPALHVTPLHADYMRPFSLPPAPRPFTRTVAYFPGSTIGNLTPEEATRFLTRIRSLVGADGALVVGADLKKDPAVLHTAYNDPEGVTAAFNLNLLARINRELGADFSLDRFRHYAHYDAHQGRIEMQLVSLDRQTVRVDGVPISFEDGEPIVTEYSYKYSVSDFTRLAAASGFRVERTWCDEQRLFSVQYLVA